MHINKLMWTWHMKFNPFSTNTCNVKAFTLPHAKHVVCLRTLFIFEERQLLENIQSFLNFFFFKLSKQCFFTIFDVYQKRFHEQLCIDNWCYNIHCSYNGKENVFLLFKTTFNALASGFSYWSILVWTILNLSHRRNLNIQ